MHIFKLAVIYIFYVFTITLSSCGSKTTSRETMPLQTSIGDSISHLDKSRIASANLVREIQRLMEEARVTGLSVTVLNANKPVFHRAFGFANADDQDPLQTTDVFYGASFSKAVFGYLVAQLVLDGLIDLDTPLQHYLDTPIPRLSFEKEWRGFTALAGDSRYEQITARMCMNHTTGFPNWRWMTANGDFFREGEIRFLFDPGSRYSYSGEGVLLLQYVIEHITGKGLETLARNRVFRPLGMNQSSYVWQERFEDAYCNGHTSTGEIIVKDRQDEANSAGSMETTPDDYSRFITEILRLHAENSPITDLMFTPTVKINSKTQFGIDAWTETKANESIGLGYGLGWGLLQSPYGKAAFKEGHDEGFQHYSILFAEQGSAVVLMSNSDNAESIFKELLELSIGDIYTPWQWERYIPYNLGSQ